MYSFNLMHISYNIITSTGFYNQHKTNEKISISETYNPYKYEFSIRSIETD